MEPILIAIIGTVFGGTGVKALDHFLNKPKEHIEYAKSIRDELRQDLAVYRAENQQLEEEVAHWRGKYYQEIERGLRGGYHGNPMAIDAGISDSEDGVCDPT